MIATPTVFVPFQTGSSVILRGSFNPAIFQPAWFGREGVIPSEEADAATVNVIHNQLSSFETPAYKIQVTADAFEVTAAGRPFTDLVRDIALGTFAVLKHTPIRAMGMNHFVHFQARSEDSWHQLGHYFAPKEFWNAYLNKPGMQGLIIRGQRTDDLIGYIDVRVEPSVVVTPNGVFVIVNDHVSLKEDELDGASKIMTILLDHWEGSSSLAKQVIDAIRKRAQ